MPIRSFKDEDGERFFFYGSRPHRKGWDQIRSIVKRKLDMLHYAKELKDMRSPSIE